MMKLSKWTCKIESMIHDDSTNPAKIKAAKVATSKGVRWNMTLQAMFTQEPPGLSHVLRATW